MKHRFFVLIGATCLIVWTSVLPAAGQAGAPAARGERGGVETPAATTGRVDKTWSPPRLPDGQPDIQGIWTNFDNTPFQAPSPDDATRLAALRKWFPPSDRTGGGSVWGVDGPASASRNARRKAMVVEPESGRVPLRPEAEAKKDYALTHLTDSWEYHTPWERCITRGVPAGIFPGGYGAGYQIFQASGVVVIYYEMIHEARMIPVDGRPHLPQAFRFWNGDSRGRWEGNTLVVDITNYNDKSAIATNIASQGMRGVGQSEQLHVVERFTIVDANTINYEATIDDPKTYTARWKVAMPINRDPAYRIFEYACHEGNHGLPNSLSSGRAEERAGR
jgi:hypothetical protein